MLDQEPSRDPNLISTDLKVDYEELIGEPVGLRSPKFVWQTSNYCYTYTSRWLYILLVIILSPIVSFFFGIIFAFLTYFRVWLIGPMLRIWKIFSYVLRQVNLGFVTAISPIFEAMGLYCSRIKVRYQKLPEATLPEERLYHDDLITV